MSYIEPSYKATTLPYGQWTDSFFPLQAMFLVFMITVSLLLINMLIAMMGNTYQVISEAQDEWLRQVRF